MPAGLPLAADDVSRIRGWIQPSGSRAPGRQRHGQEMGKIEEVWIDPKDGRVKEVVVARGFSHRREAIGAAVEDVASSGKRAARRRGNEQTAAAETRTGRGSRRPAALGLDFGRPGTRNLSLRCS